MSFSGSGLCWSFKAELFQAVHDFFADTFMIALYGDNTSLSVNTTSYITDGEISGSGYVAGGIPLEDVQILGPVVGAAYVTWADAVWPNSTLQARGALIYNQSKQQRAVAVLDFLSDQFSNAGDFHVQFPSPGPATALIRLQ